MKPGTQLAHYEILSAIGKGGMGEVWKARDTKLGREVAIKTLPPEFARDADRLARFEREAKLLASLNHPNIAAIYGLEEHEGSRFLVLELVEGDTLADMLKSGPVPVAESLKLALQIAEALEAAHEKGVIHRDLKPANIKVTPEEKIKVLDFGLAKAFAGEEADVDLTNSPTLSMQATQAGIILGTAAYMSPEQAEGDAADSRADIWSFGVVLFEMLTGRQTFDGKTVARVLAAVLNSEPEWSSLPPNLNPRVRALLDRLLEKDHKDRLSGISDARVEIRKVLDAGAIVDPVSERAPAAPQSKWLWVAALVVVAVVAALGAWLAKPVPEAERHAVIRFFSPLPEGQQFTRPEQPMVAVSSDGTQIAYVANSQIHVRNLNDTESRPVAGTNEPGFGPAAPVFSPDGEWLAYLQVVSPTESILKRVPVSGGTPIPIFEGGFQRGVSWPTPDTMLFANHEGILRIPANGGAAEVLVAGGEDQVFDSPQVLPGGARVLFTRVPGDPNETTAGIFVGEGMQSVVQTIGDVDATVIRDGVSAARYLPTGHLVYVQADTLFALAFDPESLTITGGAVPMVEDVRRSAGAFGGTANYAVSDTGTLVVIPGGAPDNAPSGVLAMVTRNGDVSLLDVPAAPYRNPRVSPDGRRIAVEILGEGGQQAHISIYDLSGESDIRQLTQTGNNTRPVWTSDSQRVTFGSERDGGWGIYERPADGSTLAERLTTADDGRRHLPDSWSSDGQTLAFTDAGPEFGDWDLWTFSRDTATAELFAGGDSNEMYAAFSPNGEWLAYADNLEPFGIRVQPFPATGVVHQITSGGEVGPVWTGNGSELFFRQGFAAESPSQISGIEVSTTGGFTFRNLRTLAIEGALMFQGYRDYDLTPDGERFVMIYPTDRVEAAPVPVSGIDVVLNWIDELRGRVSVP